MTITDNTGRELTATETIAVLKEENKRYEQDYRLEKELQFNLMIIRKMEAPIEKERLEKIQGKVRSEKEFNKLEKQIQELNKVIRGY